MTLRANMRHYQDDKGAYVLPNDTQEHERLDAQSNAIIALMHGIPFHAPVQNPQRILDIGCGTGSMTALLGQRYPDAEIIGLDISPVPERHDKPSNVTYIQGDIQELAKSGDAGFGAGTFDYIFHRLLIFGITDWPAYMATVDSLLRPAGWTEMQDFDLLLLNRTGQSLADQWRFWGAMQEDCRAIGLNIRVGSKLASYMKDRGLRDVNETVYNWPLVPTPDMPEAQAVSESNAKSTGLPFHQVFEKICGSRRSAEEMEELHAEIDLRASNFVPGDHGRLFIAVGQKPLE